MSLADETVRLIPSPLWGVSLAALCTAKTWDDVRRRAEAEAGGLCRFHADPGFHRPGSLHGHERWHYADGAARLEAVWTLCGTCHDMMHPGRVLAAGGPAALARLTALYAHRCGLTRGQAEARYDEAFEAHARSSAVPTWLIDLRAVEAAWPLRPKRSAQAKITAHRWVGNPFG